MKPTAAIWVLLLALGSGAALTDTAHAQFNPQGRKKARPGAVQARPRGTVKSTPRAATPQPSATPTTNDGPSSQALIARYTAIVLAQPGAQFPLGRLAQLYRDRDGKLDALIADFERRVREGGGGKYNAQVALAGLYKVEGRYEQAVESYAAAIAQQPSRARALHPRAAPDAPSGGKARAPPP